MPDMPMHKDRKGQRFRRSSLLRRRLVPTRYLVPNFFTLLSLCAGVTAIRAGIEARYELAVGLVVVAALLDAVDGRVARALKAQSRFGAELDSLADFVNFGVAPAIVVYTWGLGTLKGLGWISVLLFACAMSLRLARFNSAIDEDKPRWQSNFFTGVPAPAGAITVLLPLYLEGVGIVDMRIWPVSIALYAFAIAMLLVSTLPTYAGKLAGERIAREYVAPVLAAAAMLVGLLVTYPYATLTTATLVYLACIPLTWSHFRREMARWNAGEEARRSGGGEVGAAVLPVDPTAKPNEAGTTEAEATQSPTSDTRH